MEKTTTRTRTVSEHGETLVVRIVNGIKTLTDPCDTNTVVHVPEGRRARLVEFHFANLPCGRDPLTVVEQSDCGTIFATLRHPPIRVHIKTLAERQKVDVLPAFETVAAYAVIPQPPRALSAAVALSLPYAEAAA